MVSFSGGEGHNVSEIELTVHRPARSGAGGKRDETKEGGWFAVAKFVIRSDKKTDESGEEKPRLAKRKCGFRSENSVGIENFLATLIFILIIPAGSNLFPQLHFF